jgi:RecG-like helicase
MEETNDGFRIAEADLQLRGPGELLGQDQSGCPTFRFADLKTDLALVEKARDVARVILDHNGPKTEFNHEIHEIHENGQRRIHPESVATHIK